MAGKFKYLKKVITTITKAPRKGQKYTRYYYRKGGKVRTAVMPPPSKTHAFTKKFLSGEKLFKNAPVRPEKIPADRAWNSFARQMWKDAGGRFGPNSPGPPPAMMSTAARKLYAAYKRLGGK